MGAVVVANDQEKALHAMYITPSVSEAIVFPGGRNHLRRLEFFEALK